MPRRGTPDIVQNISVLNHNIRELGTRVPTTDGVVLDDGTVVSFDELNAVNNGTIKIFVQNDPPTGLDSSTDVGSLWYETDNNNFKWVWDGFVWVAHNALIPFLAGSTTLAAMGPALLYRSLVSLRIYSQATAPASPQHGWMWRDTANANAIKRWNGTAWQTVTDQNIVNATNAALTDATLTDNYLLVTYQTSAPPGPGTAGVGDLWFDTDDNWTQRKWNGSAWIIGGLSEQPPNTDGNPPSYSPTPSLLAGMGTLFIYWTAIDNGNDIVSYNVYVSTDPSVPTTSATFAGTAYGTFMALRQMPDGTPFNNTTTYYARTIAFDADGPGPASPVSNGSGVIAKITQTEISDGAVRTPQLYTNSVTSDIVATNAVYALAVQTDAISTRALDAVAITTKHTMTGPVMRTSATNPRVEMNTSGLFAYSAGGAQQFAITSSGGSGTFSGTVTAGNATLSSGSLTLQNGSLYGDSFGVWITGSGISSSFGINTSNNIVANVQGTNFQVRGSGGSPSWFTVTSSQTTVNQGDFVVTAGDAHADNLYADSIPVTTGGEAVYMGASGRLFARVNPSRVEWKRDIEVLSADPEALAQLKGISFKYNKSVPFPVDDLEQTFYSFPFDDARVLGLDFLAGEDVVYPERLVFALLAAWQTDRAKMWEAISDLKRGK